MVANAAHPSAGPCADQSRPERTHTPVGPRQTAIPRAWDVSRSRLLLSLRPVSVGLLRAQLALREAPLTDPLVVSGEQDLRHTPASILSGTCVMRVLGAP